MKAMGQIVPSYGSLLWKSHTMLLFFSRARKASEILTFPMAEKCQQLMVSTCQM